MICKVCGKKYDEKEQSFCPNCGLKNNAFTYKEAVEKHKCEWCINDPLVCLKQGYCRAYEQ